MQFTPKSLFHHTIQLHKLFWKAITCFSWKANILSFMKITCIHQKFTKLCTRYSYYSLYAFCGIPVLHICDYLLCKNFIWFKTKKDNLSWEDVEHKFCYIFDFPKKNIYICVIHLYWIFLLQTIKKNWYHILYL